MRHDGHHVATVDLPAHGARAHQPFTLDGAVSAIGDAVRAAPSPPLLVGLSLGGYSSLAFAGGHQGLIAGLLLAACTTEIRRLPVDAYRALSARVVRLARPKDTSWDVVTDMLRSLRGHAFLPELRRLHRPVWLVNGARDPMRLDERRYAAAGAVQGLTVVPRAGHDVNLHAPATFNRALREAVRSVEARPTAAAA